MIVTIHHLLFSCYASNVTAKNKLSGVSRATKSNVSLIQIMKVYVVLAFDWGPLHARIPLFLVKR